MYLRNIFRICPLSDWAEKVGQRPTLDLRGPTPDLRGQNQGLRGQTLDLRGQTLEIIWARKTSEEVYCYSNGQIRHPDRFMSEDGYYISFCPSDLSLSNSMTWQLFESDISSTVIISVDDPVREKLLPIVNQLEIEQASVPAGSTEAISALLQLMIVFLHRKKMLDWPVQRYQRGSFTVRKFFTLLEENFREMKSVAAYADQLGLSSGYLNECIKRVTGDSAKYHIGKRLIIEAQRQLEADEKSMKEIAYGLGFHDTAHFSKFFKRITGQTFIDFRARLMRKPEMQL